MPAARQRSRSPCIACAVSATIGTCAPVPRLARADRSVASKPLISGICTSISTTSNRRPCRRPPPPRRGRPRRLLTAWPRFSQQRRDELPVHGVVLGDEDPERRGRAPAGQRGRRPSTRRGGRARDRRASPSASSRSECLTGLVEVRLRRRAGGRAASSARPIDVSMTTGVARSARSARDPARQRRSRRRRASGSR